MNGNAPAERKLNLVGHLARWLTLPRFFLATGLTFFLTGVLFPFYWMFSSSFKSAAEIGSIHPVYFPHKLRFDAFRELFGYWNFGRNMLNSVSVAIPTAILAVILSLLGSYAIARLRFRGKELLLNGVLLVYLFPAVLLMIPLFAMLTKIGGLVGFSVQDNFFVLILTYLAKTLPVSLYMLTNYFKSIPAEIEEQGLVDGCSRLGVIWRITVPLSIPSIVSVAMYTFMIAWNEFLYAFVFLNSSESFTIPIKINMIHTAPSPRPHVVMAASTITTIPVMILYLALQRFLEEGLTAGGVKG